MKILLTGCDPHTNELLFRVYAQEIPAEPGRQNHKTAHLIAMDLLGAALAKDFGVRHAGIRRIGLGKPKLLHENLHMNLTHCKGLAVAAAGVFPLGVDAEAPRKFREALGKKVCSDAELQRILHADDRDFAFSQFWTLKEAYAKFTGEGIGLNFAKLEFTIRDSDIIFHHPAAENVQFYQMLPENRFAVAVCLPETGRRIAVSSAAADTSTPLLEKRVFYADD